MNVSFNIGCVLFLTKLLKKLEFSLIFEAVTEQQTRKRSKSKQREKFRLKKEYHKQQKINLHNKDKKSFNNKHYREIAVRKIVTLNCSSIK